MGRNMLKYVRDSRMECCQEVSNDLHFNELFFLLQHKEHYLQYKTYTTYNTTYNTLLILHYLLYNTSLDYDFNT